MVVTSLSDWLDRIGVEHPRGVRRGLERVRDVAARLGVLAPAASSIVVAGTNGKGVDHRPSSRACCFAAGRTVGTTTSPHLHRFNERIHINGREADDAAIVAAFEAIEAYRQGADLSYFEYAILAALKVITEAGVDHAVLEVGLGGRLDAVNIVDADVAVITSIGLDHQDYLGSTRELIGAEKAGILRSGVPLVYGERDPPRSVTARGARSRCAFLSRRARFRSCGQVAVVAGRRSAPVSRVARIGRGPGERGYCRAGRTTCWMFTGSAYRRSRGQVCAQPGSFRSGVP